MAKLVSHVIDGDIIGINLFQWSVKTPFKVIEDTDVIPIAYTDISSVQTWWDYGMNLNRDFLFVRDEIKKIVSKKGKDACVAVLNDPPENPVPNAYYYIDSSPAEGWAGHSNYVTTYKDNNWIYEPSYHLGYRLLNHTEQLICAELKIGSQVDHFNDYGVPTIVDYGVEFHRRSINVREERMLRTTVEIYNRLPASSYEVLVDLTTGPLGNIINRYEKYGVKGTWEDYDVDFNPNPTPGICDYTLARPPFNGDQIYLNAGLCKGLSLKNWNPIDSASITEFAEEIYSILTQGYFKKND